MATIGSGQYVYEQVEHWAKLPDGMAFAVVSGVAVDSEDRVYVCQQQRKPAIVVFDREGNFLDSWGEETVVEPHTIFIGRDQLMYVADRGAHVGLKMTLDGEPLLELGNRDQPSDTGCTEDLGEVLRAGGPFNRLTRMVPSPSGDIYVSDGYRNSRVHRFSPEGVPVNSWGTPGDSAPGEFRVPHSLCVDRDGLVYVCDRENSRIQIFSPFDEFVTQWTNMDRPVDIYMDADETIFLCERGTPEGYWMSVRDKAGKIVERWETPRFHQVWTDSSGDLYGAVAPDKTVTKWARRR